ncbi:MHYT domain-containing protein, partial [Cobetia sp.]
MHGSYSYPLVALSIVVAVLASHAALQLIRQVALAPSRATSLGWLVGGAVAMGLGVWAMHFIGML